MFKYEFIIVLQANNTRIIAHGSSKFQLYSKT